VPLSVLKGAVDNAMIVGDKLFNELAPIGAKPVKFGKCPTCGGKTLMVGYTLVCLSDKHVNTVRKVRSSIVDMMGELLMLTQFSGDFVVDNKSRNVIVELALRDEGIDDLAMTILEGDSELLEEIDDVKEGMRQALDEIPNDLPGMLPVFKGRSFNIEFTTTVAKSIITMIVTALGGKVSSKGEVINAKTLEDLLRECVGALKPIPEAK
jgi:hypothetical protein